MNDWLTVGQFAKLLGISTRALRIYDELGLLKSYYRGENKYRYYKNLQIEPAKEILHLKSMGFSLIEISKLIHKTKSQKIEILEQLLISKLSQISKNSEAIQLQKSIIQKTLNEFSKPNKNMKKERGIRMRDLNELTIVVTGIRDIDLTAKIIEDCLNFIGSSVQKLNFKNYSDNKNKLKVAKGPLIIVIEEADLQYLVKINPDIVLINNISSSSSKNLADYLKLYSESGGHMLTVFNADDSLSLELAANSEVRKGATYYYSKNEGLKEQILKIGGLISNGQDLEGRTGHFNELININWKFEKKLSFSEEVNVLSALLATLDIGIKKEHLVNFWKSKYFAIT